MTKKMLQYSLFHLTALMEHPHLHPHPNDPNRKKKKKENRDDAKALRMVKVASPSNKKTDTDQQLARELTD